MKEERELEHREKAEEIEPEKELISNNLDIPKDKKVSSEETEAFFKAIKSHKFNNRCLDCSKESTSWASKTLGVFLCLSCAGKHRKLGVNKSAVMSTSINTLMLEDLRRIYVGGNKEATKFFGNPLTFEEKYKNIDQYIKVINKRAEDSRSKDPQGNFIKETINSATCVDFKPESKIPIEKKKVTSFGEYITAESNSRIVKCLGSVLTRNKGKNYNYNSSSEGEEEDAEDEEDEYLREPTKYDKLNSDLNKNNVIMNEEGGTAKLKKKKSGKLTNLQSSRNPFLGGNCQMEELSGEED